MKHLVLWIAIGLFICVRWHGAAKPLPADLLLVGIDGFLWGLSGWFLGELLYERQPAEGVFDEVERS